MTWLSAAEAAEVVVGTEAVWANRRDAAAFSVFSPTLTRLAEPNDTDAGEAFVAMLDAAGVDLVWVEGLRIEVSNGVPTEHVERELLYVGRADGPGRTETGEAWVVGAVRGLRR